MSELQPGDLCVIVDGPGIPALARPWINRTVILTRIAKPPRYGVQPSNLPFWHCTDIPGGWSVLHTILRKMPPAPLEDDVLSEEELTV